MALNPPTPITPADTSSDSSADNAPDTTGHDRHSGAARLLILAPPSSYRLAPYIEAARQCRVTPLIVSDGRYSLVSEVAQGLHIDFSDTESAVATMLELAQREPIAGIIATDDYSVALAAHAAQALSLVHNSPDTALITSRKDLSRAVLDKAGLPVPAFRLIDLQRDPLPQIDNFPFPAVLKPLNLSASRGVIRVNDTDEFIQACHRIHAITREQSDSEVQHHLLCETYIHGIEVAIEGFVDNGEFHRLALFDKPDPLHGPYFEETYYITPSRLPAKMQDKIINTTADACRALGIITGPVHAEFRIEDQQVWILEVAARTIGGECARLLQFGTGYSLEQLVVSHAIGQPIRPDTLTKAAGVLMIPTPKSGILRRVEGMLAAQKVPLIEAVHINIREGNELICLPEGNSYLGFIFARGEDPAEVEQALRRAHACLNIVVAPLIKLQRS